MAIKHGLTILFATGAILSGATLIQELWHWQENDRYNRAIAAGEYIAAADANDGPRGTFARAYVDHQQGRYQEARVLYGKLENNTADPIVRKAAMFNLANTYMQQAMSMDPEKDADRAMPLVELAKTSYRRLLAIDSENMDARYNLERALQILPDASAFSSEKVEGARRAARTVISANTEDNLP